MSAYTDLLAAARDTITHTRSNGILRQSVLQCVDASEYPTDPNVGMRCFDQSLGYQVEYQSVTTGWTKPWWTPWGTSSGGVAHDEGADPITTGDSRLVTETTGIYCPPNRILKVEFRVCYICHDNPITTPAFTGSPRLYVQRNVDASPAGTVAFDIDDGVLTEALKTKCGLQYFYTLESGANTFGLIAEPIGSGTMDIRGDLTPSQVIVTDLGAAGPPP